MRKFYKKNSSTIDDISASIDDEKIVGQLLERPVYDVEDVQDMKDAINVPESNYKEKEKLCFKIAFISFITGLTFFGLFWITPDDRDKHPFLYILKIIETLGLGASAAAITAAMESLFILTIRKSRDEKLKESNKQLKKN